MPIKPNPNIILFAGAGMVKPLGLPTVTDFDKLLNENLIEEEQKIINYITQYIIYLNSNKRKGEKPYNSKDIEYFFNFLDKFLKENAEISIFMLEKNKGITLKNILEMLIKNASTTFLKLKKLIYEAFSQFDIEKAYKFYIALFSSIKSIFNPYGISFITTNYDVTFDYTIRKFHSDFFEKIGIKDIDFQFIEKLGDMVYKPEINEEFPENKIEYLKIHGSINWFKEKDNIYRNALAITPDKTDKSVLIYPGFKGEPDEEPYKSLFKKFQKRISQADITIVIGYAFRDDFINSIFENALRSEKAIYHINPTPVEHYPPESKVPYFLEQYVNHFHHIQEAVSPENLEDLLKKVLNLHQSQH